MQMPTLFFDFFSLAINVRILFLTAADIDWNSFLPVLSRLNPFHFKLIF